MSSKSAAMHSLSRLVIVIAIIAGAMGVGTVRAAESSSRPLAKSVPCTPCFRAEAEPVVQSATRDDPLGATLCRSAMSASPPLAPSCGRYR
jgi:hypothetical protein